MLVQEKTSRFLLFLSQINHMTNANKIYDKDMMKKSPKKNHPRRDGSVKQTILGIYFRIIVFLIFGA